MRIHEMAKKLGMNNKELITILVKAGFTDIKSANAGLSQEMEDYIVKKFPNLLDATATLQEGKTTSVAHSKDNSKNNNNRVENKQVEKPVDNKQGSNQRQDNKQDSRRVGNNQSEQRRPGNSQTGRPGNSQTARPGNSQTARPGNSQTARPGNNQVDNRRPSNSQSEQRHPGNNQTDQRHSGNNQPDNRRQGSNTDNKQAGNRSDNRQGQNKHTENRHTESRHMDNKQDKKNINNKNDKKPGVSFDKNKSVDKHSEKFNKNQQSNEKPAEVVQQPVEDEIKVITIGKTISLKDLSDKINEKSANLIKKLFLQGKMVNINSDISFEEAQEIALEYDYLVEEEQEVDILEALLVEEEDDEKDLKHRAPVVVVMGHVDHGKTSLLDAIRKTKIASGEAGGITQHIGASIIETHGSKIAFLDTPGHEAFTAMRLRGAMATDIAILVVAADDGVMPQTVEAINHAKAAGVEIIVAINKIDKPSANPDRVKQELVEYGLVAEDWGGDTIFVPVSALVGTNIDQLLDMVLLVAEMKELKANPNRKAKGIVIEGRLDKGRGVVVTLLVQAGTLRVGDPIVIGSSFGKVRAMIDDKGRKLKEAGPSTPVEILGLNEVPISGDIFNVTPNEKLARTIAEAFISRGRERLLEDTKAKLSLDGLFDQIKSGNIKDLNIVVKADVQGSVEAVKQSLVKLSNDEVQVRVIHGGVGAINESDVILASASNAIIIGFNVRPDAVAKSIAEKENVDLRLYRVIYNAIEDIEAAMKGMLDPKFQEKVIGHAEIRQTFKASGVGTIAGGYVLDGKLVRNALVRCLRDNIVVYEGSLSSLKRFKDDVKEVNTGYECGFTLEKYNDIKEGDTIEAFIMEEIPR